MGPFGRKRWGIYPAGRLTINENVWAKVPARCIKDMDVQVDVGVYAGDGQEEK